MSNETTTNGPTPTKRVIITDNRHRHDYWGGTKKDPLTTWMVIEDNGTEEGGKVLAEFRDRSDAVTTYTGKGYEIID